MRRGRRDDDRGADAGAPTADDQHDTTRYDAEQRPPAAYGEYGQPLFGRPAYGQPGYGNNPYPPPEAHGAPPVVAGPARGRPGLIITISLLVQLVIVAAVGNTWVVRHALDARNDHGRIVGDFITLPAVFSWRFTPQDGSTATRFYLAMMLGLAALLVVSTLLSLALVRGPITFWRAFVGVGLAVLAGVLANGMVRRGVALPSTSTFHTRSILFQGGGSEIPAGLILGLVVGLIAAIMAVVSRRPAVAPVPLPVPVDAPGPDPEAPTPWYGEDSRPAPEPYGTSPSMQKVQSSVGENAPTEAFGTKRLPDVPPPVPQPAAPDRPAPHDQATTQFPAAGRTPDAPAAPDAPADDATQALPVSRPAEEPSGSRAEPPAESSRSDEATQALPVSRPAEEPSESRAEPSVEPPAQARPDAPAGSDEPTAVRRPDGFGPVTRSTPTAPDAQSTQAFPRPPDDEELGHHPD